MKANVRIGGLVINSRPGTIVEGLYVGREGITGWFSGVDPRLTAVPRAQGHGSFDVPSFLGDRTVSIPGHALAPSPERLQWLGSSLTGVLTQGDSERVLVEYAGLTTWADARLGAKTQFTPAFAGAKTADFQLQLWCPNPRRFGGTNTPDAGTTVTSLHYGNFPATSVITVSGSMSSGYTINGPAGKVYTVTAAVVSGIPHVIDMATGLLMIDGVYVTGVVTQGDTWAVPPGMQVVQTLVPVSGTGTMSVATLDTYI